MKMLSTMDVYLDVGTAGEALRINSNPLKCECFRSYDLLLLSLGP